MMTDAAPGVMGGATQVAHAGFWYRAAAAVIDGALLAGVGLLIASCVRMLAPDDLQALANIGPVSIVLAWAYFALLESSPAQGTAGKMALGLRVCDVHGDPITFWRASLRHVLKGLSTLLLFSGWLLPMFTPRKQALHDLLAGTVVLRAVPSALPAPMAAPGDHWDGMRWVPSTPPLEKS
jgi:uncharacterized RDD family membrane protein YckC